MLEDLDPNDENVENHPGHIANKVQFEGKKYNQIEIEKLMAICTLTIFFAFKGEKGFPFLPKTLRYALEFLCLFIFRYKVRLQRVYFIVLVRGNFYALQKKAIFLHENCIELLLKPH